MNQKGLMMVGMMFLWVEERRVRDVTKVKVKVTRFHVFSSPTSLTGIQEINHQDRPTGQALMVISNIQVLPSHGFVITWRLALPACRL